MNYFHLLESEGPREQRMKHCCFPQPSFLKEVEGSFSSRCALCQRWHQLGPSESEILGLGSPSMGLQKPPGDSEAHSALRAAEQGLPHLLPRRGVVRASGMGRLPFFRASPLSEAVPVFVTTGAHGSTLCFLTSLRCRHASQAPSSLCRGNGVVLHVWAASPPPLSGQRSPSQPCECQWFWRASLWMAPGFPSAVWGADRPSLHALELPPCACLLPPPTSSFFLSFLFWCRFHCVTSCFRWRFGDLPVLTPLSHNPVITHHTSFLPPKTTPWHSALSTSAAHSLDWACCYPFWNIAGVWVSLSVSLLLPRLLPFHLIHPWSG